MIENVKKILELVQKDCCQTMHEPADTAEISYRICQEIVTENLTMRRIAMKSVPRLLIKVQKQWCINMCLEL
jgi:hypothetical protein